MAGVDAGEWVGCPSCGDTVLGKSMIPVLGETGSGVRYLCVTCARALVVGSAATRGAAAGLEGRPAGPGPDPAPAAGGGGDAPSGPSGPSGPPVVVDVTGADGPVLVLDGGAGGVAGAARVAADLNGRAATRPGDPPTATG